MATADGIFYQAKATIKKNTIILHSVKVEKPVKVRFAWKNDAQSQLFNIANLPASSFTSE
jgi:sialate O-acetylesterase